MKNAVKRMHYTQMQIITIAFLCIILSSCLIGRISAVSAKSRNTPIQPIELGIKTVTGYNQTITSVEEKRILIKDPVIDLLTESTNALAEASSGTANWYAAYFSYTFQSAGTTTEMWIIYPDVLPSNSQIGLHVKVSSTSSTGYGYLCDNQAFIAVETSQGSLHSPQPTASGGYTTVGISFSYPSAVGGSISYTTASKIMDIYTEPGFGNTKVYCYGAHSVAWLDPGPDTPIKDIIKPYSGYQQDLLQYNGYVWNNNFFYGWEAPAINDYVVQATFNYISSPTHTPPLDNGLMPVFVMGSIAHYQIGFWTWATTAFWVMWAYSPQWVAQNYKFQNTGERVINFYVNTNTFVSLGGLVINLTNYGDPYSRYYRVWINDVKIDERIIAGKSLTFKYNIQNIIAPNSQVKISIQITTWTNDWYWTLTSWMFADPWHY